MKFYKVILILFTMYSVQAFAAHPIEVIYRINEIKFSDNNNSQEEYINLYVGADVENLDSSSFRFEVDTSTGSKKITVFDQKNEPRDFKYIAKISVSLTDLGIDPIDKVNIINPFHPISKYLTPLFLEDSNIRLDSTIRYMLKIDPKDSNAFNEHVNKIVGISDLNLIVGGFYTARSTFKAMMELAAFPNLMTIQLEQILHSVTNH